MLAVLSYNLPVTQEREQAEVMAIDTTLLETVNIRRPLIVNFIKPWTTPILARYGIEWSEFVDKFSYSDDALQTQVLHRTTNPALFVLEMRKQEQKCFCARGFFASSDVYFKNASLLKVSLPQSTFSFRPPFLFLKHTRTHTVSRTRTRKTHKFSL